MRSSPIRIMLVDDHTLFRESLRGLLEEEGEFKVVAEVETVAEAIELCHGRVCFDLALIDYDLGPTAGAQNGISVVRCLRERKDFIPALMIAAKIHPGDILTVIKDLKTGIFLKTDPAEELQLALHKTMQREVWISSGLDLDAVTATEERPASDTALVIDPREREVLGLVVEGLSNKEISSRLNLSESVIKATLQRLFEKAGVRTRAQLVRFAFESGSTLL